MQRDLEKALNEDTKAGLDNKTQIVSGSNISNLLKTKVIDRYSNKTQIKGLVNSDKSRV